tara:strand:- start:150 stop:884 length:735 start_codon:yes stop_codon:yes gene_type:complete
LLEKRLIPVLQLLDERLVKTIKFKKPQYIGDPINTVRIFNEYEVDEIIFIDIKSGKDINFDLLEKISTESFSPLTYGGGIKKIDQAENIFKLGFEKIIINSLLFENENEVIKMISKFGSQAIVASIDYKKINNCNKVFTHSGQKDVKINLEIAIKNCEKLGVGEIFLTNLDLEGTWSGPDLNTIKLFSKNFRTPIIYNGGCRDLKDVKELFELSSISAVAAGSTFVYQKKNCGVLIHYEKVPEK